MLGISVDITSSGPQSIVEISSWEKLLSNTREVLNKILRELECEALILEVMPDHVHVFALCPPRHSPAYIANYLKGKSARRMLQRFPELKTRTARGKLWSRSYFVATVSNVTADVIKKYVEGQWEREK